MNTDTIRSTIEYQIRVLKDQYVEHEKTRMQQHAALCATQDTINNLDQQLRALVRTLEGITDYEEAQS